MVKTFPSDQETSVSRNPNIIVEFNEEMDANSVNSNSIFVVGVNSLVQYSAKVARLTPTTLAANTEYTLIISPNVKDLAGNRLSGEVKITFTTGTGTNPDGSDTTPTVASIFPVNGATNVSLNTSIAVTFDKEINPGTLSNSSFQLWNGSLQVSTNSTPVGKYGGAMYPLNALLPNTTYTIKITTAVTDNSSPPKPLAQTFTSNFTTGNTTSSNLLVTGTSPAPGSSQIPINSSIVVSFDRAIDPSTVITSNVSLANPSAVSGSVSMLGSNALVFTPSSPLSTNTLHTFTVTTGVQDTGTPPNTLASNYSFNFTTGNTLIDPNPPSVVSTVPTSSATGVSITPTILIQFSEPMNPTTINTTNVILRQGVTPIPRSVQMIGDMVVAIIPNSPLNYSTTYTIEVTTGVTDLSSPPDSLASTFTSTFITQSPPSLSVAGITPSNGATGVPITTGISVVFSSNVNPATLIPANITLTELPSTNIPGTITPVGSNAMLFTPTGTLSVSKTYSFQITTGVQDTHGNPLSSNYSIVFSTSDSEPDSGSVITLAGPATATSGYVNGNNTDARFNSPRYLTMNTAENIVYVSDTSNHAIRSISYPSGFTSTFAGPTTPISGYVAGTGTAARFNSPRGILRWFADSFYLVDTLNHGIRAISTAAAVTNWTPTVNTSGFVVNTGAAGARFNSPEGICTQYDLTVSATTIYVTDTLNHTVRRINTGATSYNNFVGSIAPTPSIGANDGVGTAARFNSPRGIACNYMETVIYVADSGNHTIRKITQTGQVITIAGTAGVSGYVNGVGSSARFNNPTSLVVGPPGVIFVADTGNCAIRKIVMDVSGNYGTVTTYAGALPPANCGYINGTRLTSRFNSPVGLYYRYTDGKLLVADTGNHAIRVINP